MIMSEYMRRRSSRKSAGYSPQVQYSLRGLPRDAFRHDQSCRSVATEEDTYGDSDMDPGLR